jgi:hypothetical protein
MLADHLYLKHGGNARAGVFWNIFIHAQHFPLYVVRPALSACKIFGYNSICYDVGSDVLSSDYEKYYILRCNAM